MKKIVIFNQKVAGFLMMHGFVLKAVEKSTNDTHRNVFIFNETEDLKIKISEYDSFLDSNRGYFIK